MWNYGERKQKEGREGGREGETFTEKPAQQFSYFLTQDKLMIWIL